MTDREGDREDGRGRGGALLVGLHTRRETE